jgi:hypothetical protein
MNDKDTGVPVHIVRSGPDDEREERARLGLITERRQWIKDRRAAISQQQTELREEGNELWKEDQELDVAERSLRRLMDAQR